LLAQLLLIIFFTLMNVRDIQYVRWNSPRLNFIHSFMLAYCLSTTPSLAHCVNLNGQCTLHQPTVIEFWQNKALAGFYLSASYIHGHCTCREGDGVCAVCKRGVTDEAQEMVDS
jgi:hypothetical protein